MAAVRIGGVKEAQAVVVAVEQQVGKTLHAQRGLMRMMPAAHGARSHGQPAGGDPGLAKRYRIGGGKFARQSRTGALAVPASSNRSMPLPLRRLLQ